MKVRVFDRLQGVHFKSEVYAIINSGWYEKRLVLVPATDGAYFQFVDYLDKSDNKAPKVLINTIIDTTPSEWTCRKSDAVSEQIPEYKGIIEQSVLFFEYIGFPWIFESKTLLTDLL